MCTASWRFHERGYTLWFNRDEQRSRALAEPPQRFTNESTSFLSPRDTQAGGSWIATNAHGLTLALLNFYTAGNPHTPGLRSRGLLLHDLCLARNIDATLSLLIATRLSDYAPFYLLVIESTKPPRCARWDGMRLALPESVNNPLTTSSVASEAVAAFRLRRYRDLVADNGGTAEAHMRYHRDFQPEQLAYGTLMCRSDARTVSLTEVRVDDAYSSMRYYEISDTNPPIIEAPREVTLPRSSLSA